MKIKSDVIVQTLERRLVHLGYPSGHHMKERILCEEFNVSRVPIREILHILEAKGFLEKKAGLGFFVKYPTKKEIQDLYEARSILEFAAISIIIQNIDIHKDLLVRELEYWSKMITRTNTVAVEVAIARDSRFHLDLMKCIRNDYLIDAYIALSKKLTVFRVLEYESNNGSNNVWNETCKEHIEILQACLHQDRDNALFATKRNISSALKRIEHMVSVILTEH